LRLLVKPRRGRPLLLALLLLAAVARSGVLPEDRADVMYHRYEGGGLTVQGPSVLVRKKFGESFAATANYYVDTISSASIDVVVSGASPYRERREQKSLALDYLHGKSTWSASYMTSVENDYESNTWSLSVSQDMFGDLTTVSFGYARGNDTVYKTIDNGNGGRERDPNFHRPLDRHDYRVGVTQVLTRNLLGSLNFETISEQGDLQNPYRYIRYCIPDCYNGTVPSAFGRASEIYPNTRTSNAAALMLKYYMPWRAALTGQYRYYRDTWGMRSHTAELEYTQPWKNRWVFTGSYRFATQNSADFFSDLFPAPDAQNFMARDRPYSALDSNTVGLGVSYEFPVGWAPWLNRGTANLHVDHQMIDYKEFRDLRGNLSGEMVPGTEPFYSYAANILQFYLSFWF
jgi:Protein of unknown function (DUF3570)